MDHLVAPQRTWSASHVCPEDCIPAAGRKHRGRSAQSSAPILLSPEQRPTLGLVTALGRAALVPHTQHGRHQGSFGMVVSKIVLCAFRVGRAGRLAKCPCPPDSCGWHVTPESWVITFFWDHLRARQELRKGVLLSHKPKFLRCSRSTLRPRGA